MGKVKCFKKWLNSNQKHHHFISNKKLLKREGKTWILKTLVNGLVSRYRTYDTLIW